MRATSLKTFNFVGKMLKDFIKKSDTAPKSVFYNPQRFSLTLPESVPEKKHSSEHESDLFLLLVLLTVTTQHSDSGRQVFHGSGPLDTSAAFISRALLSVSHGSLFVCHV